MIVTVAAPVVAVVLAVSVRTLVEVAGLVPNVAVTPDGRPEADKVTLPVKPPMSVTEIVLVPLDPCATERLVGDAAMLKSGVPAPAKALIIF